MSNSRTKVNGSGIACAARKAFNVIVPSWLQQKRPLRRLCDLGHGRKSDRQPYPGRRPTIALARASMETRPLASTGTCSRTRDLSCVTSAVAIVASIGARLGAAIVLDQ